MREISAKDLPDNMFRAIGEEYMLITAGDGNSYNTMTAGWGLSGKMWGNDAVMAVVRPQRYTMEFIDKSDRFTLSFYGDNRNVHKICGSRSGRDCDKAALAGLTPVFSDDTVWFDEARLVLVCKKQYVMKMEKQFFTDSAPLKWYPDEDYHYMIIGRIERVYVK